MITYFKRISDECRFFGDDCTFLSCCLALADLLNDFPQFQIRHLYNYTLLKTLKWCFGVLGVDRVSSTKIHSPTAKILFTFINSNLMTICIRNIKSCSVYIQRGWFFYGGKRHKRGSIYVENLNGLSLQVRNIYLAFRINRK